MDSTKIYYVNFGQTDDLVCIIEDIVEVNNITGETYSHMDNGDETEIYPLNVRLAG